MTFITIIYFILAVLGLSFLIFIHELGHYYVAKKKGMHIETFSIGLGKPFYSWKRGEVQWQICYLLFGGYVKISGMEKQGDLEPHEVPNGFFSKSPLARIQVAIAGPLMNIIFALICFTLLWVAGGRPKSFNEFTHIVGFVDSKSSLYQSGLRSGHRVIELNGKKFTGFKDFLYSAIMKPAERSLQALDISYLDLGSKSLTIPFQDVPPTSPDFTMPYPASYLFINSIQGQSLQKSGIQERDRIVWVNGENIFSAAQLQQVINAPEVLLTIRRADDTLLTRVPRVRIRDIQMESFEQNELEDWQYEARISGDLSQKYFIPFTITYDLSIEKPLSFVDQSAQVLTPTELQVGDTILAIDGISVEKARDLFQVIQEKHVQMIVQRAKTPIFSSWREVDDVFVQSVNWKDLQTLQSSIGKHQDLQSMGDLIILRSVVPYIHQEPSNTESMQTTPKRLVLGGELQDLSVQYNPSPFTLMVDALQEIWLVFSNLFRGKLSPKYLSGPVGIFQLMQQSWIGGISEAIYFLGIISLNLGVLNLLPIPVLDGGHILFSLYEWITKSRIPSKTMERLIIPMVVLLVVFFIYVTYQDILRLLHRVF